MFPTATHKDPFNGRCVHGNSGARIISGRRVNSRCLWCRIEARNKKEGDKSGR